MRSLLVSLVLLALPAAAAAAAPPTPYPGFSCATLLHRQALAGSPGTSVRVLKLTFTQSGAAALHSHKLAEIVYLLAGSGTNTMNGTTTPLSADAAIVIPPGTEHYVSPTGRGSVTVLTVQFVASHGPGWIPKTYKGANICHD